MNEGAATSLDRFKELIVKCRPKPRSSVGRVDADEMSVRLKSTSIPTEKRGEVWESRAVRCSLDFTLHRVVRAISHQID